MRWLFLFDLQKSGAFDPFLTPLIKIIPHHSLRCYKEYELDKGSVVKYYFITEQDINNYKNIFNLEATLAIGFRIRAPRSTQFRR